MKVYCADCRFYRLTGSACKKASVEYEDTWLVRKPLKQSPWQKNAGNDCSDYKPKKKEK